MVDFLFFISERYSNGLFTATVIIWILDSSEYWIHLNTILYGCSVFKWKSHTTWRTIQIQDISDHNQAFSVRFSDHHLNTGPFDNPTHIYHLNTRLVRYWGGCCILILNCGKLSLGKWSSIQMCGNVLQNTSIHLKIDCLVQFLNGKIQNFQPFKNWTLKVFF